MSDYGSSQIDNNKTSFTEEAIDLLTGHCPENFRLQMIGYRLLVYRQVELDV